MIFVFPALFMLLIIGSLLSSLCICICSKGVRSTSQNISRSYTEKPSKVQILLQSDMLKQSGGDVSERK